MLTNTTVRAAHHADLDAVLVLAQGFATSFAVEADAFALSFHSVVADSQARLSVVVVNEVVVGYALAFKHLAFYANGPVVWVEEIVVREELRGHGLGRLLMGDIEAWAYLHGVRLVALATRRAAPFYRALGYEESAMYFRKII